ncbi:MAG TPA: DUF5916 domain-containing protein, partial [Terriglobia bacterium]|nr:DUF5916 domain-containing protein [Terriglobia bacterium]
MSSDNLLCLFAALFLMAGGWRGLAAQQRSPEGADGQRKSLQAERIDVPIRLDGVLDESAWQETPAANGFIQSEPYEGEPATEQTEVKVLYDNENLYIGVYCHDAEPGGVLVNSLKEDFDPDSADYFQVILDTYLDRRGGFLFTTNPEGAKRDAQVTDEGRNQNADWDTVWDVRARRNGDGWSAEFVIPFKSLSFDARRAEQVWGVNFGRKIRRKNEVAFWSPVPRRYDITRLSLAGDLLGLEGIERGRDLRVKPFAIADFQKFARQDFDLDPDGGLDVKYNLTPTLTLDSTFNTDFSQVEVDEQQINLTRFPVIFPEKREFFLENSGIFQFGDIPGERGPDRSKETQLFFSRRIGLFPDGHPRQGEPIGIWGGARLSGSIGNFRIGVMNLQTKAVDDDPATPANESLPANNFGVVRIKRNVLANSDIGAILVNRQSSASGDYNRAYGVDANFRFFQNLAINAFLARTQTPGRDDASRSEKIGGNWRDNIFRIQLIYSNKQRNFNPEVGFKGVPAGRQSARDLRTTLEAHLRPPRNAWVREVNPHHRFFFILDEAGRTVYKEGHYAPFEIFFHNGARAELSYNPRFERLNAPFLIPSSPDVSILPGDYAYAYWQLELESDPSKSLFGTVNLLTGDYYTGHSRTLNLSGTYRPNHRWSAQATFVDSSVDLPEISYATRLVRSRITYSFSTRLFLNALIQYNSSRKQVTSNIRLDFIHHPLSNLYLVFNEARDVSAAHRNDRSFTVKYTHS